MSIAEGVRRSSFSIPLVGGEEGANLAPVHQVLKGEEWNICLPKDPNGKQFVS